MTEVDWEWFSGTNDEFYQNGPFLTRDEAVEALDGCGGHIVEAVTRPVRFSAKRLIDEQYFDDEDGFDFEYAQPERKGGREEIESADNELQRILDQWTDKWRHTFIAPSLFAKSRNEEYIAPEGDAKESEA